MRLHRFVRWAQDRSAAVRLCSRSLALKAAALVPISGDWDGFHQVLMVGKLAGRGEGIRQGEKKESSVKFPGQIVSLLQGLLVARSQPGSIDTALAFPPLLQDGT